MYGADGSDNIGNKLICASYFDPLFLDFFRLPHFPDSGTRTIAWQKSPDTAHAETTERIIPDLTATRLAYGLSNLVRLCSWYSNNNLFHKISFSRL